MNKWTCEDCVKKDTDDCYFRDVIDGHKYCQNMSVDPDHAFKKGVAYAICEFVEWLDSNYDLGVVFHTAIISKLKQIKEEA